MTTKTPSMGTLIEAVAFAADKHRDQRRKDVAASPYINHPIALANVLANEGGVTNLTALCAAVLHDTVEDTDTTEQELVDRFGSDIASVVMEVTDDKSLDKARRKELQIEHAPLMSYAARLVKLADKISNLRDIFSFTASGLVCGAQASLFRLGSEGCGGAAWYSPSIGSNL